MMKEHNYYTPEVIEILEMVDKKCGINLTED